MHRSALRLRLCCQSKLHWSLYNPLVRRLSSASTVPVVNSDEQVIEKLEPWQDKSGKALAIKEGDDKGIIVDDLSATLEAHRASNRAAVIRKIILRADDSPGPIRRPLQSEESNNGSEVKHTHKVKQSRPRQIWPADSVQAKERYGKTGTADGFVKKVDAFDYTGVVQWPKQSWKLSHDSDDLLMQRPWLAYMETTSEDCLERITEEIKAYEAYMRLSPEEEAASELVISDVNSVALNEPGIKPLTLLGSRSTGLATPISDFDFAFTLPALPKSLPGGWIMPPNEADVPHAQTSKSDNKPKILKALKKMDRHFRASKKFSNTDFVQHARVPIIRTKHAATGLDVQIQTSASYQATQEYTVAYLSEFPSLRPLYIVLRYCLEIRDLTTVFEGGLGSYSILMMIVTVMKHSSGKFALNDLGGQLLHVLEFYGKADLYKFGFSADPPRVFEKEKPDLSLEDGTAGKADSEFGGVNLMQKFYPRKPYLLCLQDPANDLNDLGKNAYAIKHIQEIFNNARESIQALLGEQVKVLDDRAKGGTWSFLDSVVRADYRPFEVRRSRVERWSSSGKLNDRDHSKQRLDEEFEKRVARYRGVAEEGGNLPRPALQAFDTSAAEGVGSQDGLDAGRTPGWYRKGISRIRPTSSPAGTGRVQSRGNAIAAESKKANLQKLHGINDDEFGWQPSSPHDPKTLLEAISAPRSALLARFPPTKARAPTADEEIPIMHTSPRKGLIRLHHAANKPKNMRLRNLQKKRARDDAARKQQPPSEAAAPTAVVQKVFVDKLSMRRAMMPPPHKRVGALADTARQRVEESDDGAVQAGREQDRSGSSPVV